MMEEVDFVEDMDSDDLWLKSHIEDIVDRYAHKVIAILDQQIVGVGTSHCGTATNHRFTTRNGCRSSSKCLPVREFESCCSIPIRHSGRPAFCIDSSGPGLSEQVAAGPSICRFQCLL